MSFVDEKPRSILQEYKLTENLMRSSISSDKWDYDDFKRRFKLVIVRLNDDEMEFDLIGVHHALANALRRIMLSEVPTMAIDKVHILNNTTILQDEVLAHRLGLIPLKADPRLFEMKTDPNSESTEQDSLEYTLKIKCTNKRDGNKDSSRPEDLYKNHQVYSKHIKWHPIGQQKLKFKEEDVQPIHDDILIAKLRPGHELDLKLIACKGTGKEHAKFSPVCTAYYRLLPEIKLVKNVEGAAAEKLKACFAPGVIEINSEKGGKKRAFVKNSRYDIGNRNVYRYEELKDSVVMSNIQDHFIFTIESVGALKPDEIFVESVKVLKNKCLKLLEELSDKQ